MGNTIKTHEPRILMGGLDSTGKTTILYQMKLGYVISSIPTIGFNIQQLIIQRKKVQVWDLGGSAKLRELYQHYFNGMSGLIYVVDLSDEGRLSISMDQLWDNFLKYIDVKIPILIFGSKSDIAINNFAKFRQIIQKVTVGRSINFVPCNALTGQGLKDGMKWLVKQITKNNFIMQV